MLRTFVCAFLFVESGAFGQLDSNSVTVSVSRSVTLQPDQAQFAVTVDAGIGSSIDDVLAAVQGSGITLANLTSVSMPSATQLEWDFQLAAPLAKLKDTIAALTTLQRNIVAASNGMTLSFQVQGTQISAQLQQAQTCDLSGLLAGATSKAGNLANGSGLSVGTILSMSSSASTSIPGALFASGPTAYTPPNCTLTVEFALGRF